MNVYAYIGTLRNIQPTTVSISVKEYDSLNNKANALEGIMNPITPKRIWNVKPVTVFNACMDFICEYYHVSKSDLLGKRRLKNINRARQILMYVCNHLGVSLAETGRMLGKDHSTVIHSRDVIKTEMQYDDLLFQQVAYIFSTLKKQLNIQNERSIHIDGGTES